MTLEKLYGEISELVARLQGLRTKIQVEVMYSTSGSATTPELMKELSIIQSKIESILNKHGRSLAE